MKLESIVTNLTTDLTRHETLEGRDYLVVPMVMAGEGVLNGSNGPLFYPKEELGKTPVVWNHKPVVVYHPTMNGQAISACDPDVINSQKVGLIMNTVFDETSKKLKAEAWLEKSRMDAVDPRIAQAIAANQKMEVSTGLFTDNDPTQGEYNGKQYSAIARNYRPDHLAILPDKIGAFSVADGGGLLANELSFSTIRERLTDALRSKFGFDTESMTPWVVDVFNSFVVYEYGSPYKLYRIDYVASDVGVVLTGEPEEVVRVTEYRTLAGTFVGNSAASSANVKERMNSMKKAEMVDALIANKATQWGETDKAFLMSLNEDALKKMSPVEQKKEEPSVNTVEEAAKKGAAGIAANSDTNSNPQQTAVPAQKAAMNAVEYIEKEVPPELRDVFREGMAANMAERQKAIATITANKRNQFTAEQLNSMNTATLKGLASLAVEPEPAPAPAVNAYGAYYYGGAAGVAPSTNAGEKETPLESPKMTFDK